MLKISSHIHKLNFIMMTTLLTACGGGGGSGGGSTFQTPDISNAPVAITATNEQQVVETGVNGSNGGLVSQDIPFFPGVVVDNGGAKVDVYSMIKDRVFAALEKGTSAIPNGVVGASFGPETENCFVSGTETYSGNATDTSGNTISAGDSITIKSNNCDDGFGEITNGTMSFTINDISPNIGLGDTSDFNVDVTITFDDYKETTTQDGTVNIHGDMRLVFESNNGVITMSMSGNSMYVVTSIEAIRLTDYDIGFTLNSNTSRFVTDASFTVATTEINGSITVNTHLEVSSLSSYPDSGSINITGSNSSISVNVLDSTQVEVTLTIGGVVQPDYPKIVTWQNLDVEIKKNIN